MTTIACSRTPLKTAAQYKKPLAPILCLLYMLLQPPLAWAEGAVRVLGCSVTQVCDAAGTCEAAPEEVSFRLTPKDLREDGSGQYEISYRDIQAHMEATTYAGPFYWSTDMERNTLLASSETRFLWHRLTLDPTPEASVYFLACTLQQ